MPALKMCGATVQKYSSSGGLGGSASQIDFTLIEDLIGGDIFVPPAMGSYQIFEDGGFKFEGVVSSWTRIVDIGNNKAYSLAIQDMSELLSGVQVILSGFQGAVNAIPNMINVFGYWQHVLGFSGALNNESGMLWDAPFNKIGIDPTYGGLTITEVNRVGVKIALEYLSANASPYSGGIRFAGSNYSLDLSALSGFPDVYRVGGGDSITVIELISQVCQDAGLDYILYLENYVIKLKTIDRKVQPSLTVVKDFVDATANAKYKQTGIELRNDVTNAVLIGGAVQTLYTIENPTGTTDISPFWGLTPDGIPVVGQGDPSTSQTFILDGTPIADILGGDEYHCDIPEIRCALSDYDSWVAYILKTSPEKAETIGLIGCIDTDQYADLDEVFGDVILQRDLIDYSDTSATAYGEMNKGEDNYWLTRGQRVYDFVMNYAQAYGKKFLVKVPTQVYYSFESETSNLIASEEISDGGYVSEGSTPLGLSFLNQQLFLTDDGRFQNFVRFDDYSQVDFTRLDPSTYVVDSNGLFMQASIDSNYGVVYPPGSTFGYVVLDLASPVYAITPTPLGNLSDIATILDISEEQLAYAIDLRHGSFPLRINSPAFRPNAATSTFKSNTQSYGPWHTSESGVAIGIPGKVYYEKDEGLTPWSYGGYSAMNEVAYAKIANIATGQQAAERGTVTIVGSPICSLGDLLVAGGPNVTRISVEKGIQGFTAEYEMQTFTPKKLAFSSTIESRDSRLAVGYQQSRKAIRQLNQRLKNNDYVFQQAQKGFLENASRAVLQKTPHDVLCATVTKSEKYGIRTQISTQTGQEALGTVRGDRDDYYKKSAAMSLEGLLRPFSTKIIDGNTPDEDNWISHYQKPNPELSTRCITNEKLNPIKALGSIDIMLWGDNYPTSEDRADRKSLNGMHALKGDPDYDNARVLALRGPLILTGHGYDIGGLPVPNKVPSGSIDQLSNDFADDYLRKTHLHKTGCVDLAWDESRGVWGPRPLLFGNITTFNNAKRAKIAGIKGEIEFSTNFSINTAPPSGTACCLGWNVYANQYYLISLNCYTGA